MALVQSDHSHCSCGPTWVRYCFPLGGGAHLGCGQRPGSRPGAFLEFFAGTPGGLVASDLWHPGFPFHGHGDERLPQGGAGALSAVHGLAGCGHRPRSQ